MSLCIDDIIAKRREQWERYGDIERDRILARAAAREILKSADIREAVTQRPYLLIEACFDIVDKKQRSVPFFFNEVQRDFIAEFEKNGTKRPYCILKGRQQGFTSLITAIQLSFAITRKNFSGFTLADCSSNTQAIFNDKARTVYSRLPNELKPTEQFNSARELFFNKLNSSWRVSTATSQAGRSKTLNFVHFSEAGFYRCALSDLQRSVGEAMTADAFCVYESTANGFNEFKELWDSGSCVNLFYGWWRTREYRSECFEYINNADKWLCERIRVLEDMGLDREQIAWYCERYASYLDKRSICQEFPCTPQEAFIASGNCVFDKDKLYNRMLELSAAAAPKTGSFEYKRTATPVMNAKGEVIDAEYSITDIRFVESADGFIRIHEEPRCKRTQNGDITARAPYTIGGDTADAGEDFYTAKVICNLDGRTAATLQRQRMDEDEYAEQLYCLGIYYNTALIGVETNYSRYPMRVLHNKYRYPRLYFRERIDGLTDKREQTVGFETTAKTRPIIISRLVEIMRDSPFLESDMQTLKEMSVFVKKSNGRQEAESGEHDDLVMALAIAHFICAQQTSSWIPEPYEEADIGDMFGLDAGTNTEYVDWEEL